MACSAVNRMRRKKRAYCFVFHPLASKYGNLATEMHLTTGYDLIARLTAAFHCVCILRSIHVAPNLFHRAIKGAELFSKILVPLDGSELAEAIIPYVGRLASTLGAELVMFSAIDPGLERNQEALRQATENAANYHHEVQTRSSISAISQVEPGEPYQAIVKAQSDLGCDLVAMSTHGRTGIMRGVLGSVSDRVLHLIDVPILLFSPQGVSQDPTGGSSPKVESIVVPLDGSELSEEVVPYVEQLAIELSARVILLQSISVRTPEDPFGGGYVVDPAPVEEELAKQAESYLSSISKILSDKGVEVQQQVLFDTPHSAIIQVAQSNPNSLVAMGTRGQSGVTRLIVGSVTSRVVRECGSPILVVPPRSNVT